MSLHVVVDSTASMPQVMFDKYGNLHCVSLNIMLGDKQWRENQLSAEEMFKMADSTGYFPRTSQPAPGDFVDVIEPLVQAGHDVIVITMSGALSGTVQSAQTAVTLVGGKHVYVVDSGTVANGMINLAETALAMGEQHKDVQEIVAHLQAMASATQTIFTPETLDYLYKNGRIGGAAALFGTILNIKPILYLVDGKVKLLEKVRTRTKAMKRMLEELEGKNLAYVGIPYVVTLEDAEALAEQIRSRFPGTEVQIVAGGAVLGAHLGAGVIGIIYQEEIC